MDDSERRNDIYGDPSCPIQFSGRSFILFIPTLSIGHTDWLSDIMVLVVTRVHPRVRQPCMHDYRSDTRFISVTFNRRLQNTFLNTPSDLTGHNSVFLA